MDQKMLVTLEYDKIIETLIKHCETSLGKEKAAAIQPSNQIDEVRQWLEETDQAMKVVRLKGGAPFGGITNIRSAVQRAAIGGMLNPQELLDIANTVHGGRRLKDFLLALHEQEPIARLHALAVRIEGNRRLESDIRACIDDHAEVVDHASPELARVRAQIRTSESRIREKLEQMIRSSSVQKKLQEQLITIRNDRYVIPVKAEYRAHFGGLVHDQSTTGATLFIEPEQIVQLNNQIKEYKLKEQAEIEKILLRLSGLVAEHADELQENVKLITELDVIFAKAGLAQAWNASLPIINDEGRMNLKKARHPLIDPDKVVPIDVRLGDEHTMLMITGPNTGGKTVTLKTVGLLHLMAASGFFIPAEDGSEACVFDAVYADIGDEQSIEQSLSTFSSHMTNIIRILKQMTSRSLILLDELGAGTDPAEGSALAVAILEHIRQTGCRLLATTHYSELKAYAFNQPGVINASMEFDVETLSPTYRLLIGIPGRSNAFSIAERLGLPKPIIEDAKGRMGEQERNVESMIATLESNRIQAEIERESAAQLRSEAEALRRKLYEQQKRFEQQREKMWQQAQREAEEALKKAKEEAEQIIAELREIARKEQASIKEHKLIDARKRLEQVGIQTARASEDISAAVPSKPRKFEQVEPGDEVRVLSLGQTGFVVEEAGQEEVIVQLGILKMKVHKTDIEKLASKQPAVSKPVHKVQRSSSQVRTELDLRGMMLEEALIETERFLDQALLDNLNQVYIIHGKGTGVLRKGIQELLKQHRHVASYRMGNPGEGGTGVTVAQLK